MFFEVLGRGSWCDPGPGQAFPPVDTDDFRLLQDVLRVRDCFLNSLTALSTRLPGCFFLYVFLFVTSYKCKQMKDINSSAPGIVVRVH